jgi:predicted lipoprotein with Yx(FWY)xxD motif
MRHLRLSIAAVAVAAAASVGGITLASSTGSSHGYSAPTASQPPSGASNPPNPTTVRVATATVQGSAEKILVDANGLPLYIYQPDTADTSRVTGRLATLWPPLVAAAPTDPGVGGQVASISTTNGKQVSYNGHFLYTFVEDQPGQVTGQGVQNFYVATPDLVTGAASAQTSTSSAPPSARSGFGY